MKTYAGIDLHSSNSFIGVINQNDEKLHSRRHYNNLKEILKVLRKYKKSLQGVVVESTYNWYWLVDGLMEQEYKVHLANPTAIQQYKGLKNRDDKYDAFWLAHLLRLGILPQGYIYPKSLRPVRDLFRRRTLFVKQRTAQTLSLQSMIARNRGIEHSASVIVHLDDESYEEMFDCPNLVSTALHQIGTIRFLEKQIKEIEAEVETVVELDKGVLPVSHKLFEIRRKFGFFLPVWFSVLLLFLFSIIRSNVPLYFAQRSFKILFALVGYHHAPDRLRRTFEINLFELSMPPLPIWKPPRFNAP